MLNFCDRSLVMEWDFKMAICWTMGVAGLDYSLIPARSPSSVWTRGASRCSQFGPRNGGWESGNEPIAPTLYCTYDMNSERTLWLCLCSDGATTFVRSVIGQDSVVEVGAENHRQLPGGYRQVADELEVGVRSARHHWSGRGGNWIQQPETGCAEVHIYYNLHVHNITCGCITSFLWRPRQGRPFSVRLILDVAVGYAQSSG